MGTEGGTKTEDGRGKERVKDYVLTSSATVGQSTRSRHIPVEKQRGSSCEQGGWETDEIHVEGRASEVWGGGGGETGKT